AIAIHDTHKSVTYHTKVLRTLDSIVNRYANSNLLNVCRNLIKVNDNLLIVIVSIAADLIVTRMNNTMSRITLTTHLVLSFRTVEHEVIRISSTISISQEGRSIKVEIKSSGISLSLP